MSQGFVCLMIHLPLFALSFTHFNLWCKFHFDINVSPRATSNDVGGHAVVGASVLLAHAGEHEHVALEDRRVSGKNGIILPPPVDLRRRVSAGIALELNPL